jgi:predicted nucleotide-binding protein
LPASDLQWSPGFYSSGTPLSPLSDYIKGVARNREHSLVQLREAVRTLEEDLAERTAGSEVEPIHIGSKASPKVFLVHGREDGPREAVARFLERLGFEPIILHEQANQGRTVIEKVEAHSDVGFAVVLLTPDDEGNLRGEASQPRARQNVLLELGISLAS